MNDYLDNIVKRMNNMSNTLSKKSNAYFKKAVYKSEEFANKGIQQIEIEKLKWELKKNYIKLGKYVYNNKNIFDYSHDDKFILLLDKIKRLEKHIKKIKDA